MKPIPLVILVAAALLAFGSRAGADFDPSGYQHRAVISFASYTEPETLNDFPVLIRLGEEIPGFAYSQFLTSEAGDLRFVAEDSELSYEIDTWNPTGNSLIWVRLPALVPGGTKITAYWGNASVVKPVYATDGSTWSNGYLGVWHLNEPNALNSVNGSAGTGHGNVTAEGNIGDAQSFALPPANTSYIDVGNLKPTSYTLSAWTRNSYVAGKDKVVFRKSGSFFWEQWNIDYNVNHSVIGAETQYFQAGGNIDLSEPAWTHEVVAYDSSTGTGYGYMNGSSANGYPQVKTPIALPSQNDNPCTIGKSGYGSYYGEIDEVRLSSVVRSAAWIKACHANQNSPEIFAAISMEVDPMLSITTDSSETYTLSWPVSEWVLQSSQDLGITSPWSSDGLPEPIMENGINRITGTTTGASSFFRLMLPTKDFGIDATPALITIPRGTSGGIAVEVFPVGGFTELVTLDLLGVPAGVTSQFSPPHTFNSSALSFEVDADAAAGTFPITVTGTSGSEQRSVEIELTITAPPAGAPFSWPAYSPDLNYDFRSEYPGFEAPTEVLDDCPEVVETIADGWWCFRYGPNKNPLVTSAAWNPMLERMNSEFAYFREVMGWPPDKRAQSGYYSSIYLFGSGLCTDDAPNDALGGWQSSIFHQGENWPMVLISYYPVWSFDPAYPNGDAEYQRGATVHEGIHSVLAGMPGIRNAGWFHEGGSGWLQGTAAANQSGDFNSIGWLSAGAMIAPFMPIECYSGWLQDGSFGGPSAEGVNVYEGSTQLCTWRNLLGGTQYGECFATFMGEIVSQGSVAWIWQNCPTRVLEGLASPNGGLGPAQTRRLIKEFRGRQAMCDFGRRSPAYANLLNGVWGSNIRPEYEPIWIHADPWTATCYVDTTNQAGTLIPEERTLPGWSGANQIPLTVAPGATNVSVDFQPIGANMSCQLVYRATDGSVVYSYPVSSGTCSLNLDQAVENDVVIAVICNTDYAFTGDALRSTKFDYRLTPGTGISGTAYIYTKWWKSGTP
jgi:hypothetical protein